MSDALRTDRVTVLVPPTSAPYYHVAKQATLERDCPCGHSTMWTITYHDGNEWIEIGTAWQGPDGQESAEDICDLMNMAFDAGKECRHD